MIQNNTESPIFGSLYYLKIGGFSMEDIVLSKVKEIYHTSKDVDNKQFELNTLKSTTFPGTRPEEPDKQVAKYNAPFDPDCPLKYSWKRKFITLGIMLVIFMISPALSITRKHAVISIWLILGWLVVCGGYFFWIFYDRCVNFSKKKLAYIARMKQSPEYLKEVEIRKEMQRKEQQELDRVYNDALEDYTQRLHRYNIELNSFNENKSEEVNKLKSELEGLKARLNLLCDEIGELPYKYRNSKALSYIYSTLESSKNTTLKEAVVSYDRHVQQELLVKQLQEAERAAQMHQESSHYMSDDDYTYDGSGINAGVLLGAAHIVQTHNTNKYLKKMTNDKPDARTRYRQTLERQRERSQEAIENFHRESEKNRERWKRIHENRRSRRSRHR